MLTETEMKRISDTPLFVGLDQDFLFRAAERAEERVYAAGEPVVTEGGETNGLGILLSGKAQVHKVAGDSRVLVSVLEPPAMTGASCLFMNAAHAVTEVRAVKPCRLAFFGEETLRTLMKENFAFAENYMRYLTGRIRFLTQRIESIGSPGAAEKLMNYLALTAQDGSLTLPMGYSSLAHALCISRASLYRVLDELENAGRLHRCGKTLHIINSEVE